MWEAGISICRLPPSWKSLSFVLVWIAIEFWAPTAVFRERLRTYTSPQRPPPGTSPGWVVLGIGSLRRGRWAGCKGVRHLLRHLSFSSSPDHPCSAQWQKVCELGVSGLGGRVCWFRPLAGLTAPWGLVGWALWLRTVLHIPVFTCLGGFSLKLYFSLTHADFFFKYKIKMSGLT